MSDKYELPSYSLISFMSNKVKVGGGINFAQGIPGFAPPKALLNELSLAANNEDIHQYAHGQGFPPLVALLHTKYFNEHNISQNQIRITDGATEAIWIIFNYLTHIIKEDFCSLAFDPVYESYKHLPLIFNKKFTAFSLNKDLSINFDFLEAEIKNKNIKVIFVNSPGNPLGKVWTQEEFAQLHLLCKKYDIYIIVDAVYKDIALEKCYQPLDILDKNIFFVDSFSKALSITGWRLGYYICHKSHLEKLTYVHDYTGLSSPSVLQYAVYNYLLKNDFGEDYKAFLRKEINANSILMQKGLKKLGFDTPEIKGGYYIWTKLPEKYTNSFEFAIDLYEQQKVAIIPGLHFSDNQTNYIRINIARPKEDILEGLKRIKSFVLG